MKLRSVHWSLWTLACTLVVSGTLALQMASSTTRIPIVFKEHAVLAEFEQRRLVQGMLKLSLHFPRQDRQLNPHGSWDGATKRPPSPKNIPSITFTAPGVPVDFDVVWGGVVHPFEAMPSYTVASSANVSRTLVPRLDDENPNAFGWPVALSSRPMLAAGKTTISVKTRSLHPSLVDQAAVLVIEPPVSFKYTTPGYELLWWFYFWPVYVGALAMYGALLLRKSKCSGHQRRRRSN